MFKIVLFTLSIFASCILLAGTEGVDLGDSTEKVIEEEGKPTEVSELKIKDKTFVTYFYKTSNSSYVIDKELNMVCELALGKTDGPATGTCP